MFPFLNLFIFQDKKKAKVPKEGKYFCSEGLRLQVHNACSFTPNKKCKVHDKWSQFFVCGHCKQPVRNSRSSHYKNAFEEHKTGKCLLPKGAVVESFEKSSDEEQQPEDGAVQQGQDHLKDKELDPFVSLIPTLGSQEKLELLNLFQKFQVHFLCWCNRVKSNFFKIFFFHKTRLKGNCYLLENVKVRMEEKKAKK